MLKTKRYLIKFFIFTVFMALLKDMLGHHIYHKNSFYAWQISGHDIEFLLYFLLSTSTSFLLYYLKLSSGSGL